MQQEVLLKKSCGVARYSYNWALTQWKLMYESGNKPSAYALINLQNQIKREQMPFFLEVSKSIPQGAIMNLEKAFKAFLKGNAKYPKFKKKGVKERFLAVENQQAFNQGSYKIHIPRIGKIRCAENLRFDGKVHNVIVTRIADKWFASINIETPDSIPALKQKLGDNQAIAGIDFGIKSMMVLSDGTIYENPKALKNNLQKLKRQQRRLSRKKKGSQNRRKQILKVAKLHYRISCIRGSAIHKATSEIVGKYDKIIIEDLNVPGMVKNRKLARSLSDVSFGEISRQLAYKAAWGGAELIRADRFYPSSKTCSNCGGKNAQLKLSERIYNCESCGTSIDRDLNAAKNLANYGTTAKFAESHAFGVGDSLAETHDSLTQNKEAGLFRKFGKEIVMLFINHQSKTPPH